MSLNKMLDEFNSVFEVPVYNTPDSGNIGDHALTINLIQEEVDELDTAMYEENSLEMLDALTDIIYAAAQQARKYGFDIDEALSRVHESNLSKLNENGEAIFGEGGKVLKGPNYFRPNLKDLV